LWRSYSNTAVSSAVSLKREITFSSYGPKSRRYLQVLSALTARMGLTQDLITPFQKAFTFKSSASESSQNNKNFIEIGFFYFIFIFIILFLFFFSPFFFFFYFSFYIAYYIYKIILQI
jgi:hypothetical protein